jgi:membrane protease YdiL (CAAX protease family)
LFDQHRRARLISLPLPPLIVVLVDMLPAGTFDIPPLVLSLVATGAMIMVIVTIGGIELGDIGLDRDYVGRGVGVTAMIWGAAQILGTLPRVVANRPVALAEQFEFGSRWEMAGTFLHALGNATGEEIAFRGFLLVQLYLHLSQKKQDGKAGVLPAVAVTLIVANLAALPGTLPYPSVAIAVTDQVTLLFGGTFLCWLYLRTRNLFFTIGVHALLVAPSPVVAGPRGGGSWYHPLVIALLAATWTLLWPRRD